MIENIRSLKNNFSISLNNPIGRKIYKVDSINLLIGDNGSGKTQFIKSFIDDVTGSLPPSAFLVEGATDQLGIVYYTAVPFHKPMKDVTSKSVIFTDASSALQGNESFIETAEEYLGAAEALNVADSLQSICSFSFDEAALQIAKLAIVYNEPQRTKLSEIDDMYFSIRRLTNKYRRLERERLALQQELRSADNSGSQPTPETIFARDNVRNQIGQVSQQLELIARERLDKQQSLNDRILFEAGPRNRRQANIWTAFCCTLQRSRSPSLPGRLAKFIFNRDFEKLNNGGFSIEWDSTLKTVTDFTKSIEKTSTGTFDWNRGGSLISVDTPALLKSKISEEIIESAHKAGLVRIGFDKISSGEAAIFHQLTSLANSIRTLKIAGKKNMLIFIDEGDMLLHLAWQREYLSLLDQRLGRIRDKLELESVQIIVATHSPLLATDVLRNSVTRIGGAGKIPAFGAPIQSVVNRSFETPSIGAIAERTILELRSKHSFTETDKEIIDQIDDVFVRNHLLNKN